MIKEQIVNNETVQPNTKDMKRLKADFPQFFAKDGAFLLDRFKRMLKQSDVTLNKEGYELNFLGKSYARYLSSTETETFLAPFESENTRPENQASENLYIIGDNIDALKHMLHSYAGKIKCIYIDPPYNTGNDGFVYPDNFSFNAEELSRVIGIEEEEATRILNLSGKSNHSAWLTFIYPRLILARELLSDDGVIFISIDDNEQVNLKMACDEVFGEENFVSQLIWERAYAPKNDAKYISNSHDYVLMYARVKDDFVIGRLPRSEEANARYTNPDNDPRGAWKSSDMSVKTYSASADYPIKTPSGRIVEPPAGRSWSLSEKAFSERLLDNRIWFGKDGDAVPSIKRFLSELKFDGMAPISLQFYKEVGHSQEGAQEVVKLFDGLGVFDGPKPVRLISRLLTLANLEKDDFILDFFSGSATTAHAVMNLNAEDGGNRKYIMVQLPEVIGKKKPAYKAGYRTIDEIGRERIRRAAQKIKEETEADIDYGFKTFKIESVRQDTLNKLMDFDPSPSLLTDDMISVFDSEFASGLSSILSTWMNQDGYGLHAKAEAYQLKDYQASLYADSLYIIQEGLQSADVMRLIERLERFELDVKRIVVYAYSVQFSVMHELKKNVKTLRNNKTVEVIERY